MNFAVYCFVSTIVLLGTVVQTYIQQEHFYPTLLALSQEKVQLAVIYNFLLMLAIVFVRFTVALFVGRLTPIELEQLIENGRSMIADTILFLIFYSPTINGREISTVTLVQFIGLILVLKVFHSICQIRISRMFEVGIPSRTTLLRIGSLLVFLLSIDIQTVFQIFQMLEKSSTFYTWLLFEFVNVSISAVSMCLKFAFNLVDLKISANGWPGKSVYVFYTELVADIAQMTSYILFMGIFFYQNPSRLPIYAIADVIQVARQLANRLRSFKKYREITRNMDARFPNASADEIEAAESCIICRDKLTGTSKVLQCGHIFHSDCLKSWAVVQQTCPTCRAELVPKTVVTVAAPPPQPAAPPTEPDSGIPDEGVPEPARRLFGGSRVTSPSKEEVKEMHANNISQQDLAVAIGHAQAMAKFYQQQAQMWSEQVQANQAALFPPEPASIMAVLEELRKSISSAPSSAEIAPPELDSESSIERKETEQDLEEIRNARRQKYESELRNRHPGS